MRHDLPALLFNKYDLDSYLKNLLQKAVASVDQIPENQFHISADKEIVRSIVSKRSVTPIELYEDRAVLEQSETKIDVGGWPDRSWGHDGGSIMIPGTSVTISYPFTGDPTLWEARPNRFTLNPPRGSIRAKAGESGFLDINVTRPSDEGPGVYKPAIDRTLTDVKDYLSSSKAQIEVHNNSIAGHVLPAIQARRARLAQNSVIANLIGIPLTKKDGAPSIQPIHVQPRIVVDLPPVPKTGLKPEPGIADKVYEDILSIIRHEGRTFETTPKTYRVHDEEELRDIMLAHLNGHFKGGATGETFRRSGKTDIRIEQDNRAAFVGECKVWRGGGELGAALDQLTGYLTWRDCKAAVVVFNKEVKGFSELLDQKVPVALKAHPNFIEMFPTDQAGEWNCIFRSKEDPGRRIKVRVFLFNLFSA